MADIVLTSSNADDIDLVPTVELRWQDRFAIAGSRDRFNEYTNLNVSTNFASIGYGQKYTQPGNWTNGVRMAPMWPDF